MVAASPDFPPHALSSRCLLIVDDEPDVCANLSDILQDQGYRVDVAHCGQDALQLVRQRSYAAALVDYRMPGMDGVELCREIRRIDGALRAIVLSAYTTPQTAQAARAAGAVHVVSKPVDMARLLKLVAQNAP